MQPYSVLMSVYHKEKPDFFRQSISSMLEQTALPADFVIVADGALPSELDAVLNDFKKGLPDLFHILRLEQNEGQGIALQKGLLICKCELVARMDSDDISVPERCFLQLKAFEDNPELVLLGGQIEEFDADPSQPYAKREVPLAKEDIYKFARKRNPFNHMAVMFKKSGVLRVGNYQPFPLFEDYWLWVRMLNQGVRVCNLPQVLVKARAGKEMLARRGGIRYAKRQADFQKAVYGIGFISLSQFLCNVCVRVIAGIVPWRVRRLLYKRMLRNIASIK